VKLRGLGKTMLKCILKKYNMAVKTVLSYRVFPISVVKIG
jgi:hypothetical protein